MRKRALSYGIGVAAVLVAAGPSVVRAADPLTNSRWASTYSTEQGARVNAAIQLQNPTLGPLGGGAYQASVNGQPVGNGTFSQVRVQIDNRQNSPLPGPGSPLPGPTDPLAGVKNNMQTKYIVGLWRFGTQLGWFKWELYEANGQCRFVGKWGYLIGNMAGPTKGTWNGTLQAANGAGPVGGGEDQPLITIGEPFGSGGQPLGGGTPVINIP